MQTSVSDTPVLNQEDVAAMAAIKVSRAPIVLQVRFTSSIRSCMGSVLKAALLTFSLFFTCPAFNRGSRFFGVSFAHRDHVPTCQITMHQSAVSHSAYNCLHDCFFCGHQSLVGSLQKQFPKCPDVIGDSGSHRSCDSQRRVYPAEAAISEVQSTSGFVRVIAV
jgi:hypothetical protein